MESSTAHLPGWLQRAMSAPGPTRVDFPDSGYISVFPDRRRYASNIQNWASPALWETESPGLSPLQDGTAEQNVQPLDQLHWTLTRQQVRSRGISSGLQYRMVRLTSWPALTYLPDDVLPTVARICALLARKPTTVSLIPLLLDQSEEEVFPLIETLRLNGHLQLMGGPTAQDSAAAPSPQPAARPAEEVAAAPSSLIGKLWQRLSLRGQG